jgi:hypothetical protein
MHIVDLPSYLLAFPSRSCVFGGVVSITTFCLLDFVALVGSIFIEAL